MEEWRNGHSITLHLKLLALSLKSLACPTIKNLFDVAAKDLFA